MKKIVLSLAAGLFAVALSGQAGADERHHASASATAQAAATEPAQSPAPAKAAAKKKKNPRKSSAHFHPRDGK